MLDAYALLENGECASVQEIVKQVPPGTTCSHMLPTCSHMLITCSHMLTTCYTDKHVSGDKPTTSKPGGFIDCVQQQGCETQRRVAPARQQPSSRKTERAGVWQSAPQGRVVRNHGLAMRCKALPSWCAVGQPLRTLAHPSTVRERFSLNPRWPGALVGSGSCAPGSALTLPNHRAVPACCAFHRARTHARMHACRQASVHASSYP